jgi:hypothetical protein
MNQTNKQTSTIRVQLCCIWKWSCSLAFYYIFEVVIVVSGIRSFTGPARFPEALPDPLSYAPRPG